MNEDLIALTAMFSGMAVVISLAVLHGTHRAQEVQETWRKLADRHRLHYEVKRSLADKTKVTGSLAGRPFLLQQSGSGNKASVQMELELRGSLPDGLRMKQIGKASGRPPRGSRRSDIAGRRGQRRGQDQR